MLGKIVGLLLLRKTMSDSNSLIESLLAGMAAVAILTLIATLLFGILIMGGIYVGYQMLLANGLSPLASAQILLGVFFCLFILCVMLVFYCIRSVRNIPRRVVSMHSHSPVGDRISQLTDAFMNGLNTPVPPATPAS